MRNEVLVGVVSVVVTCGSVMDDGTPRKSGEILTYEQHSLAIIVAES